MNFIFNFFSNTLIAFLILISIVVIAHELGHFLVGRLLGIDVEEFAIGFGPKIFSFKIGRTEYRINWIFLGGYVRFYGPDTDNKKTIPQKDRERSIVHAKLYKRMCVSFAGPFANIILSLFIMVFLYSFGVTKQPAIFKVLHNSIAYQAGFQTGDKILSIDGKKTTDWSSMMQKIITSPNKTLQVEIERNNTTKTINVTPKAETFVDFDGTSQTIGRIGVTPFFSVPIIAPWQNQFFTHIGLLENDKIVTINSDEIKYLDQVFQHIETITHSDSDITLAKQILSHKLQPLRIEFIRNESLQTIIVNFNSEKNQKWANMVIAHAKEVKHGKWETSVTSAELTISDFEKNIMARKKTANSTQSLVDCGLKPHLTIRKINHSPVFASQVDLYTWFEVETNFINKNINQFKNNSIPVKILTTDKDGYEKNYSCFLSIRQDRTQANTEKLVIDFPVKFVTDSVLYPSIKIQSKNFIESFKMGARSVASQMTFIYNGFKKLFSGHVPLSSLGGPIAIAGFAGDAAKAGFETFLMAMSLMSVNIGIFNLLPLPMLDGGTLLLQIVEIFYRKPIPKKIQMIIIRFGIAFLLTLFIFVFYNDIMRLFS